MRDVGADMESEPDEDHDAYRGSGVRRVACVHAVHLCPWTIPHADDASDNDDIDIHPCLSTVHTPAPPSFTLCEQAYCAYQKQLCLILLPAMVNLVRHIVVEAGADTDSGANARNLHMKGGVLSFDWSCNIKNSCLIATQPQM